MAGTMHDVDDDEDDEDDDDDDDDFDDDDDGDGDDDDDKAWHCHAMVCNGILLHAIACRAMPWSAMPMPCVMAWLCDGCGAATACQSTATAWHGMIMTAASSRPWQCNDMAWPSHHNDMAWPSYRLAFAFAFARMLRRSTDTTVGCAPTLVGERKATKLHKNIRTSVNKDICTSSQFP